MVTAANGSVWWDRDVDLTGKRIRLELDQQPTMFGSRLVDELRQCLGIQARRRI